MAPVRPLAHRLPAVLVFVTGAILTVMLYKLADGLEQRQLQERFDRQVDTHMSVTGDRVNSYAEVLYSLRMLFDGSDSVSRPEFAGAAADLMSRRKGIQALEWVPQILREKRQEFEQSARADGPTNFEVTERGGVVDLRRAGDRPFYWPILFAEPVAGNERVLGFDLAIGPTQPDLRRAIADGDIVVSSRFRLVQSTNSVPSPKDYGIVAILPVYERGLPRRNRVERERAHRGFVQGVFRLHEMMEAAFAQIPAKGADVVVIDESPDTTNRLLHFHPAEMRTRPVPAVEPVPFKGFLVRTWYWKIGGRTWTYSFRPSPEWVFSQRTWTAEIALGGGMLLTALLTAFVNVLARRTLMVERLVEQRTAELSRAKERLETEARNRETTENALRRSEAGLMAAQRIARVGSWESLHPGGAVHWSEETFRIFGVDPTGFKPTLESFYAAVHPDDRPAVRAAVTQAMASKRPYQIEHRTIRPDGTTRYVIEQAEVVIEPESGAVKLLGTVQDITDRLLSEAEKDALDRKIQETQKLESLGVLAGGIAHDFNNLLTGILGNASLARMELPVGSSVQFFLEQIEHTSQRAAELCRQMLAYSGKGRFVVERIDLSQLIEGAAPLLRLSVSKKAVLRFDLARPLPPVVVDVTQIRQIVMNLVINASDAIGDRSGVISVGTGLMRADRAYLSATHLAPDLPEGDYVFIEVSDSGCGMSPETLARIFDPFFTTKFTGRGLGLAAALGIVRGHRGAIRVYSEPGCGSTFKLLLPASEGSPESIDQMPAAGESWRGEGRLLVVDDEETVRTVVARMAEVTGFKTVLAADGREGVARFTEDPQGYAAVLLDLTMPHMDGDEAFQEMRKLRPDVRVILMSGFNEQEAINRFAGKGLAGFLQKPFKPELLRDVLQSVFNRPPPTASDP